LKLCFRRGSAFANKKALNYLADKNPEDIRKITVIRHAAIGDFMNIRPFLIELRKYFPNAEITLSVLRNAVYGMPRDLIDEIHIMDKENPKNSLKKTGLFTRIKQAKALPPQDIIFDLTDSTLTSLMLIVSTANLKIGYPYRALRRIFLDMAIYRSSLVVEAELALHMLNFLGLPKIRKLHYGFENTYPKKDARAIIYFRGASEEKRRWDEKKFISLIDKISKEYPNHKHIILQGINKDEQFLNIYKPFQEKQNIFLQQAMDLESTMQFLANSSCVIAGDTGIRNMAIAVETPTIGLFFVSEPFSYWPNDSIHDCVFNNRYESPSVEEVYKATITLMQQLYS
jgi:ADP-heptose:LPS heptosyltransferase